MIRLKSKYLLFCALTALAMSSLTAHAQSGLRPHGDVNCDWEVNIADVNALADSVMKGVA